MTPPGSFFVSAAVDDALAEVLIAEVEAVDCLSFLSSIFRVRWNFCSVLTRRLLAGSSALACSIKPAASMSILSASLFCVYKINKRMN